MTMDNRPAGAVKMTTDKVNELELFAQNLTWVLRAQANSKHYVPNMAVDVISDKSAVLIIGCKRYGFGYESLPDLLAQVVDLLGSPTLPAPVAEK